MIDLYNRVAIVTGGAGGIGRATSLILARQGADVAVVDINIDGVNMVVDELKDIGVKAMAVKTDVSDFNQVKMMVKDVQDKLGRVDILVNNAAGRAKATPRAPFYETTEEGWHAGIALNLDSIYYCCRAVIGSMMERRYGKIVNISSIDGLLGSVGNIDYATVKAGILSFTMSLAKEMANYGINVNSISPGPIETPGLATAEHPVGTKGTASNSSQKMEAFIEWTGIGRLGKPEDIGYTVAFLVSDEAGFITGQNIPVCGLANLAGKRWSMRYAV